MSAPAPPDPFGHTSLLEEPRNASERARFEGWCAANTLVYAPRVGAGVVLAILLWWPLDLVVYAGQEAQRAVLAQARVATAGLLGLSALLLPRVKLARRHALTVTVAVAALASALTAFNLARVEESNPFGLAFFYIAPLFSIAFLQPLAGRLVSALLIGGAAAAGYLLAPGAALAWPATRAALSYLVFTSLMAAALGHGVYLLVRTNFLMRLRVDEQRASLAALAESLEERVNEQTAELRLLHRRAQDAGADQNRRIARDLHDGLGQELSSLRLLVGHGQALTQDHDTRALFGELEGLVARVQLSLRRVLQVLRPRLLDEQGLVEALRTLLSDTERRWGLQCRLDLGTVPDPCPSQASVALFRIAQEAIHNVLRHAHATELVLRLHQQDAWLVLEVQDDGRGMSASPSAGHGLDNIRERAAELGGTAIWEPNGGTLLRVLLPLEAP